MSATGSARGYLLPILVWRGVSETTAAYFVGLFAFGTIIATLGMGWMGDRWRKPFLCSLSIMPTIVAMLGLTHLYPIHIIYLFLSDQPINYHGNRAS